MIHIFERKGSAKGHILLLAKPKGIMKKIYLILITVMTWSSQAKDYADRADAVTPLLPGMTVPAIQLINMEGNKVNLDIDQLDKPLILTFYRGGWCPYCNAYLGEMRTVEKELKTMGFDVYFVSPSLPENSQMTQKDNPGYQLFADPDSSAAKALGIAFQLDEQTKQKYINYGIDLQKLSGHDGNLLPAPATFLIGQDGVVQFQYVNPDYKIRLAPSILKAAAEDYIKRKGHLFK